MLMDRSATKLSFIVVGQLKAPPPSRMVRSTRKEDALGSGFLQQKLVAIVLENFICLHYLAAQELHILTQNR